MKTIVRGLIGLEDMNVGGGTFSRTTSSGGTQTMTRVGLQLGVQYVDSNLGRGGIDIGDEINKAYLSLSTTGGMIVIAPGTYNYTTPILIADGTVAHKTVRIVGSGRWQTVLNYTPTSGTALTLDVANGDQIGPALEYLTIIAGAGRAFPTVGLQLGASNGCSGAYVNNVNVQAFGTGVKFGNLTFRTLFQQCWIGTNAVAMLWPDVTDSGSEQMIFNACSFNSSVGGLNSPVNCNGGMGDIIFVGCSFDDSQLNIPDADVQTPAKIVCYGCHFENPQHTTGAFVLQKSQALVLDNCTFVNDATSIAKFVSVTGTSSNSGAFLAVRQPSFLSNGAGGSVTDAVRIESGATGVTFNMANTQQLHNVTNLYTDNGTATVITPLATKKQGSNAGNYTTASTSYVDVDATNLKYVVTIPIGSTLSIMASGLANTLTGSAVVSIALADGGVSLAQAALVAVNTTNTEPWSLNWMITGDGLSHDIRLRYSTSNASDSANMSNASGFFPVMLFQMSQVN